MGKTQSKFAFSKLSSKDDFDRASSVFNNSGISSPPPLKDPKRELLGRSVMTSLLQSLFLRSSHTKPEPIYTLTQVADHCDYSSCWIVIRDKVYDVTELLSNHPGGLDVILENAGSDATAQFEDKGHSKFAIQMLDKYYIGELAERDRRMKCGT